MLSIVDVLVVGIFVFLECTLHVVGKDTVLYLPVPWISFVF
jgi:hypothetical protein